MKKRLFAVAQLTLGLSLICYIFIRMTARGELHEFSNILSAVSNNWPLLLLGFSCFFTCLVFCAERWRLLLMAQDLKISFSRVLTLCFVGHFFNTMMPGVTGGDVLKAVYATREAPQKKTAAVATVAIDRILGLFALIILAVIVMATRLPLFLSDKRMTLALVFNIILLVGVTVMSVILFRHNLLEKWLWFKKFEQTKVGAVVGKLYVAFRTSMTSRSLLVKTVALSALNHLMFIVMIQMIGYGLGIYLSFYDFLTAFLIINAVAAIPITPGGLGMREGSAIFILGVFGVPGAGAFSISILIYATLLAWGLVSGIVYMFYVYRTGKVAKEETLG